MRNVALPVFPPQQAILTDNHRFVFLGAGIGAGKTCGGSIWSLKQCSKMSEGEIGIICANSYPQLFDSTLRGFYKFCKIHNIPVDPPILPRSYSPLTIRVWMGNRWTTILCRSLDRSSYAMLSGLEVSWWWADEVWQTLVDAIELLMGRLREKTGGQGLLTTTLDDTNSWMYRMVESERDDKWVGVHYAPSWTNTLLPTEYLDSLKARYSARLYERMVEAKWVSLDENQIYSSFHYSTHVDEHLVLQDGADICWSHDQNVGNGKPMSSIVAQIVVENGVRVLNVLDEIVIESADTRASIEEFKHRYGNCSQRVVVYGDASGRAKDSRSGTTDYHILAEAGYRDQRVPRANPPIRDRHNEVNALLLNAKNEVRLRIHPRCKVLIQGLQTVALKKGARYLEEETYHQHATAALGYLVHQEFPIAPPAVPNVSSPIVFG